MTILAALLLAAAGPTAVTYGETIGHRVCPKGYIWQVKRCVRGTRTYDAPPEFDDETEFERFLDEVEEYYSRRPQRVRR
jgi:hypothetical protein